MKYANCSGATAVRWSRGLQVLKPGQSIDDDHPLVKERPDLFTDAEPEPDIKMPATPGRGAPRQIETGAQAPGETRTAGPGKRASRRKAAGSE